MSGVSDFLSKQAMNPRADVVERTRAAKYDDPTPEVSMGDFPSNKGKGIYGLSMGLTSNPIEQAKIIKNLAKKNPNINVRDRYGDGKPLIEIGGEAYHMNKPGASWNDLWSLLGESVTFLPGASALRAVKRPMSRALVAGLTTGATQAGKEAISEDLGGTFDTEMIGIAAASGLFGQGVLEGAGKLLGLVAKNKGKSRIYVEKDGKLEFSPEVKSRLEAEGIDPNQFSDDSIRKMSDIVSREPKKVDATAARQADSDITLSRNEANPQPAGVAKQNQMMGDKSANMLNEHELKQLDEIDSLIKSLGDTKYLKKYVKKDDTPDVINRPKMSREQISEEIERYDSIMKLGTDSNRKNFTTNLSKKEIDDEITEQNFIIQEAEREFDDFVEMGKREDGEYLREVIEEAEYKIENLKEMSFKTKSTQQMHQDSAKDAYKQALEKADSMGEPKEVYDELAQNRDLFRNSMKNIIDDNVLSFEMAMKGDGFGMGSAIGTLNNKNFPENYRKMLADKLVDTIKKNPDAMTDKNRQIMMKGLFDRRGAPINSRQSLIDTGKNLKEQLVDNEKLIRSMYPNDEYGDFVIGKLEKLSNDLDNIKLTKTQNVKKHDKKIMMILRSFHDDMPANKYDKYQTRWQKTAPVLTAAATGLGTAAGTAMIPGFPELAVFLAGIVGAGAGRKMIPNMIKKNITHPRQMQNMLEDTSPVWNRANIPGGEMLRTPTRAGTYAGVQNMPMLMENQ